MTSIGDQSPTSPEELRKWLGALPGCAGLVDADPDAPTMCQVTDWPTRAVLFVGSDGRWDVRRDLATLVRYAPFTVVWLPRTTDAEERA